MKRTVIALSVAAICLSLVSCGNSTRTCKNLKSSPARAQPQTQVDIKGHEEPARPMLSPDCEGKQEWGPEYYSGGFNLDPYFAMIDSRARTEEDACWPEFCNFARASCLEFCPADTCHSERVVLLLSNCQERPVVEWMNGFVYDFMHRMSFDGIPLLDNPKHAKQIADYYVNQARAISRSRGCRHTPEEHDMINEQMALFMGMETVSDDICTFMTHSWYDMLSSGDCTARSWHTVLRKTGEDVKLQDIIPEEHMNEFLNLVSSNLRNWKGLWRDVAQESSTMDNSYLLDNMSGCALVDDGLVVYYHPYRIGCGADGQFNALIPYSDLLPFVKPDCPGCSLIRAAMSR